MEMKTTSLVRVRLGFSHLLVRVRLRLRLGHLLVRVRLRLRLGHLLVRLRVRVRLRLRPPVGDEDDFFG